MSTLLNPVIVSSQVFQTSTYVRLPAIPSIMFTPLNIPVVAMRKLRPIKSLCHKLVSFGTTAYPYSGAQPNEVQQSQCRYNHPRRKQPRLLLSPSLHLKYFDKNEKQLFLDAPKLNVGPTVVALSIFCATSTVCPGIAATTSSNPFHPKMGCACTLAAFWLSECPASMPGFSLSVELLMTPSFCAMHCTNRTLIGAYPE